jgi:release factor glutamine methyltransferase
MRSVIKYIVARTYRPLLVKYLAGTRTYCYKNIVLEVPPEVFHPGFFFSTKFLLSYISRLPLYHKRLLELGAGSGLIACYAGRAGAHVVATDINPVAVETLQKNSQLNGVALEIIHSDLFRQIPKQTFDIIAINPPYYKKKPIKNIDYAWFCGEDGEYFRELFKSIRKYMHEQTEVLMITCDSCDMEMLRSNAAQHGFRLEAAKSKKYLLEEHTIFKILSNE